MAMLDVPDEILGAIILFVTQAAGLHEATKLRLICRRFDELAQDCIFRLPRTMLASERISEPMRVKLIQSRLRTESSNKLCCAIRSTADYLTQLTSPELYERYNGSLVRLAARSMIYWHLIDSLSTPPEGHISFQEIQENALVAAAKADQPELVKKLLSKHVNAACNTRYFGEMFAAAAASGSLSLVLMILEDWDWNDRTNIRSTRYVHAVQAAAVSGHKNIVITLVNRGRPLPNSLYDDAIAQTVKAGRVSMVELLLNLRQEHSNSGRERVFWATLIRTAVEWNKLEVLQYLVQNNASMLGQATFGLAIEDACRKQHYEGLQILLPALQDFPDREAKHYTGGLFWTAWSGSLEHLTSLVTILEHEKRQILRALAGAISGKRRSIVAYLLRSAGVDLTDQDLPTRFTDAVRLILPETFSSRKPECARSIASLAQSLFESSKSGNLAGVIEAFQAAKVQHPNDDLRSFSCAFCEAAKNNHPDILLYLCENRAPHLITAFATSTAIVRIFEDFGWDVNQPDVDPRCPRLGKFIHDEHVCRWLIDNGASLDTRGDKDITPISGAVCRAPMSTIRLFLGRCSGVGGGQLLHFAVERDDEYAVEVVELLLNLGCPVDSIMFQDDPRSWMEMKVGDCATPLLTAVFDGKTEVVKLLLSRGADPTRPSTQGSTPLEVAEWSGCASIVDLLKQYR